MQFRNRFDLLDDQVDVVTRGLMGLTVACARCHDHKYDPISTADYHALVATFALSHPPRATTAMPAAIATMASARNGSRIPIRSPRPSPA